VSSIDKSLPPKSSTNLTTFTINERWGCMYDLTCHTTSANVTPSD